MHKALKEDERTHNTQAPNTPAYYFVTLNYQPPNQWFGPKVKQLADYLDNKIREYRNSRGGTLTLDDFRTKFLACTDLREEVFTFVYLLFKLEKISRTDRSLWKNELGSLLNLGLLFNLCMVIEQTIDNKKTCPNELRLYSDKIRHLIDRTSLSLTTSGENKHGIINNEVKFCSDEFGSSFSTTMTSILQNNHSILRTKLPIESDLVISLGIRNHSAHKLQDQPVVYQHWEDLAQRVLNVLFFTVEKTY
jgi:hypothetical protein